MVGFDLWVADIGELELFAEAVEILFTETV